jgi:hypothetical protein
MRKIFGFSVIGAIGVAIVAMMSGCASYSVVQGRNNELDRKALQVSATPNGGTLAVDMLGLKGYWQAWKAEPAKMTGATLLDVGTAAGAALLVNQATKSNDSKPDAPAIQNNGGTVIVNTGSGNTSYSTTQTGAAE